MSGVKPRKGKSTNLNHFVARFTSRPWLMATNKFYKLSIENSAVRADVAGPKSWGGEQNLYAQPIEDALEQVETRVAGLHTKLQSSDPLTQDERYGWAMWLLASYMRTPLAFLCSAEVAEELDNLPSDLFETGSIKLAQYATNPYCIDLIANRRWKVFKSDKPYFLKPDSGVVLTNRLDADDCVIIYPLSPCSCFVACVKGASLDRDSVSTERMLWLNEEILGWSEKSAVCTTEFWKQEEPMIREIVKKNLGKRIYSPPTSGRFFSIEAIQSDNEIRTTILAPRGPMVMTVPASVIRPIDGVTRPTISGLYDVEEAPSVAIEVRYSDDEKEINYAAAARLLLRFGQPSLAVNFARKGLEIDPENLVCKLVILDDDPSAKLGELVPKNANEAAELAIWWALARKQPLDGLKVSSEWLKMNRDHEPLAKANFLCALLAHGATLIKALCGKAEPPAYIDDSTPLPAGVIELVKKIYSQRDTKVVSKIQDAIGKMDLMSSGLAADIMRVCGLDRKIRLYTRERAANETSSPEKK